MVEAVGGDTLALLRPESIESETAWVIDAVPSDRTFRVDEAVAVRIELVRPSADLVVSLRADGKEVARADDPEIIESRLAPGTYTIRAAAYSGDSRTLGPAVRLAVRVSGP